MRIYSSIFILIIVFFSCETQKINNIEPSEFKAKIENLDAQLLDVRTLREFALEHIPNALLIDVKKDNFLSISEEKLSKKNPIYIYCRSGKRSRKATKILQENGFTKIYNLEGGFLKWKTKNYPIKNLKK